MPPKDMTDSLHVVRQNVFGKVLKTVMFCACMVSVVLPVDTLMYLLWKAYRTRAAACRTLTF